MDPKYIDIHSHLNLEQFDNDREDIIKKLKDENITTITVGANFATSVFAVQLAEKYDNLFASVGLHPSDVLIEEFNYDEMLKLAHNSRVVSIGECGLDYFRESGEDFKNKQKEIFHLHVKIALETGKPLMIHARASKGTMDAYIDVLDILEVYKKENPSLHANFHFFAGDIEIAKRIIELGFSMSFDGPITFSHDYDDVIRMIPIHLIMAETDAPFASPVPYRGKRCEPQMVKEVYRHIAQLKNMELEEVRIKILQNIKTIFKI